VHVDGVMVAVRALRDAGVSEVVVPAADAAEASLIHGVKVTPASALVAVMRHLAGSEPLPAEPPRRPAPPADWPAADDLAEVHGQEAARRALEIAAAGGHHLLLSGPPGAGK